MKITPRMIVKALRLYSLADDNTSTKVLRNIQMSAHESFAHVEFSYDHKRYAILFGSSVDEDSVEDLWPNVPDDVVMLPNPLDPSAYTTPFHGKQLILFQMKPLKQRLDNYLAGEFDTSISRSLWQKYISSGYVSVNGSIVESHRHEVDPTDIITVTVPKTSTAVDDLPILYEDDYIVAVDKPSGMLTHQKGGISDESTVADFFRAHTNFATNSSRPGIIHRLDRDTSGAIVGARTEEAAAHLQKQFANRTAKKIYIAVVEGQPKLHEAQIDLPIGRHPAKPSTFRVDPKGKDALTSYRVIATDGTRSLVELQPKTGRTHQLRVHMAYIGTPIVGDRVYGKPDDRLMLHAHSLSITLPSGEHTTISSPVPSEFLTHFPEVRL